MVPIRVPAPAPLTGVAVGPHGIIWASSEYRQCVPHGGTTRCRYPRFISYNPRSRRFDTFVIPRRDRPLHPKGDLMWNVWIQTPMAASPDGWVWALFPVRNPRRHESGSWGRLVGLRDGRFRSFLIPLGSDILTRPIVDRHDNVWLCGSGGHPLVVDPRTGKRFRLKEHGGTILQDWHRKIWYIRYPSSEAFPCGDGG